MKTVLVVEDEKPLNEAITMKLKKKGFNVLNVFLAEEAINILEKQKIKVDFIWLDLLLPQISGLEFLKHIKNNPGFKNQKIAVVSVSGSYNTIEAAKKFGITDYIVKSEYKLDDIIDKVANEINNKINAKQKQ